MVGKVHDPRYKALVDKLRQARLSAGLSQAELALRLNRRQQFVSKYESFERRLDVVEFADIANLLNLDWVGALVGTHASND